MSLPARSRQARHAPRHRSSVEEEPVAANPCLPSRTCAPPHAVFSERNPGVRFVPMGRSFHAHANERTRFPLACQSCLGEGLAGRSPKSHRWINANQRRPTTIPSADIAMPSVGIALQCPLTGSRLRYPVTIYSGPSLSRFARELQAKFAASIDFRSRKTSDYRDNPPQSTARIWELTRRGSS
jgi:hypothetical protein